MTICRPKQYSPNQPLLVLDCIGSFFHYRPPHIALMEVEHSPNIPYVTRSFKMIPRSVSFVTWTINFLIQILINVVACSSLALLLSLKSPIETFIIDKMSQVRPVKHFHMTAAQCSLICSNITDITIFFTTNRTNPICFGTILQN